MITIQVPTSSDWRVKFKFLEMAFFNISEEDWPIKFTQRIEQLTQVYDALRHRAHVQMLNTQLGLRPQLTGDEFNKTVTLARLREVIVEPRIPAAPSGVQTVTMELERTDLDALDMGHLHALIPKK